MHFKSPKKTLNNTSTQSLLKTARIVDGRLLVTDRIGVDYSAQRGPHDTLQVSHETSLWSGFLVMDAWCREELAWWEEQLEALTPARCVWLLLSEDGVVVGHLSAPEHAAHPDRAHPFRVNNLARRPLPALGERYSPPGPVVRPPRTRGAAERDLAFSPS